MIMSNPIAIFFGLGDTLVIPQFGADGALAALQPRPFVTEVMDRVRSDGTVAAPDRLGVRRLSGLVPSASPLSRVAADPMSSRTSKGVSDV